MPYAFDQCPDRPENIEQMLSGLDRYNPETTTVFQDYVAQQCETQTYDCYANLALLKLYQFNPHLTRDETTTNILLKSLTVFPSPDFSLALSLLPPHILQPNNTTSLAEAVQQLLKLHTYLTNAQYREFWDTFESDDSYADLAAEISGFEDTMRVRIAVVVSQCMQGVSREVLEGWLNLSSGAKFEHFVKEVCGWTIDGDKVKVPLNKDNEARSVVQRETVKFDQFGRMVKRAYEQPA